MTITQSQLQEIRDNANNEHSFEELFDKEEKEQGSGLRKIVTGKVVAVTSNMVLVDVGLKSEGWIPSSEFSSDGTSDVPSVDDEIEVYVERLVSQDGQTMLSRLRARREEAWKKIEDYYAKSQSIIGHIKSRVRGGFVVDIDGAQAFLPGSQVDLRPVRDITPLMNCPQPFRILKINRLRGNIVVSRRAIMEEGRAEKRDELYANLSANQVLEGMVKNITDYGAFVDLGGIDGLIHVTDISWTRISHASEALSIGDTVKVKVLSYSSKDGRVALGLKQLEPDPWEGIELKYPQGAKIKTKVTNITDYGAFVALEQGIEGLVHISEMSWTKKTMHPNKFMSVGEEIEVMVLEVNKAKRRVSLGMKQCSSNPYQEYAEQHEIGDIVEGPISSITDFGIFISLDKNLDGMVYVSDLAWDINDSEKAKAFEPYSKGQVVKAKILEINTNKERISLGFKQLSDDPISSVLSKYTKGSVHTCVVEQVNAAGVTVSMADKDLRGFIKRNELARSRQDQRPDRFAPGEKLDAKIIGINRSKREVLLSIKSMEVAEMKEALATYGSAGSGASLGEILGEALKGKQEKDLASKDKASKDKAAKDSTAKDKKETKAKTETKPEAKETKADKPEAKEAKAESKPEAKEAKEAKADKPKAASKAASKAAAKDGDSDGESDATVVEKSKAKVKKTDSKKDTKTIDES